LEALKRDVNFKERRSGTDRRTTPRLKIRSWHRGGTREIIRRRADRNTIFIADRYSQSVFAAILLIIFFSVLDALLTLYLMGHDATAYYLDVGPYAFLIVKYLLTSGAVVILLLCQNAFLRIMRIHAYSLFYVIIAAFMIVVVWELFLIFQVLA
jgi:hypothetical protein